MMIVDRYRVEAIIGQGGMGVILKAFDTLLNLDVAMKVLAVDHTGTNAARLQREASSAGKLNHPNIARIYEFGQTPDGSPYMVMELLTGLSLAQHIEQNGRLFYQAALPIFRQITSALDTAHKQGVVHRDLKPSNIMIVERTSGAYQIKLLDFGIAKTQMQNQTLTATGAMVGSPLYASPEQALGQDVDHLCDIYSFGVLMFEVLSGKPPFVGATAIETLSMHKRTRAPLLSSVLSPQSVPPPMVELVDKCLQKEKENRPQSMKEISDILSLDMDESFDVYESKNKKSTLKKVLPVLTLVGCVLTAASFFIYSPLFIKKEQKKLHKAPAKKLTINSNWEAMKYYRVEDEEQKFRKFKPGNDARIENTIDDIKDEDLKELQGKKVSNLLLMGCTLTGKGFRYLRDSDVQSLRLRNCVIDDDGIKELSIFKKMKLLIIDSPAVTEKAIPYINRMKEIYYLTLDCPRLNDHGVEQIDLPNLRKLILLSPNITDASIESLKKNKLLEELHLMSCSVGKDVGIELSKLTQLKSVTISGLANLSLESMKAISEMKIDRLTLKDCILSDGHFDYIAKMNKLWRLDLNSTIVSASNLDKLSALPRLVFLDFAGRREITDEMIDVLMKLKLKTLDLRTTKINPTQLRSLLKIKTLEQLWLSDCEKLSGENVQDFIRDYNALNKRIIQVDSRDLI